MDCKSAVAIAVVAVGLFFVGRFTAHHLPDVEVVTRVDTIRITDVKPDTICRVEYVPQYFAKTDTVEVVKVDSVLVYVPVSTYIFQDSTYRAEISGYNVALKSMEIYNRTTTLRSTPKRWGINAGVDSYVTKGQVDMSVSAGVEYRLDRWSFSGDYKVGVSGSSGVALRAQYLLFAF